MKEFIEKLIDNIGKISELVRPVGWSRKIEVVETKCVIQIIKQLAEEYNNGWISCSDKVPSSTGYYLVTIKGFNRPMYAWWIWTEKKWYYLNSQKEIKDVIAWKPLPPVYQPKGEKDSE